MWCYQKPGFEALLLAELQRQQQCSQFCDTLLKTEGASVPAHSCILSAISPQISSALSSALPPPPGQSRLLDFGALGACTLLHMVSLLYSGEMAGEGEKEKREAVSAAAKLGIRGLVEVTRRDRESRHEEDKGQRAEVGVQTQPVTSEESEGRQVRWRIVIRDGETLLSKVTWSDGERDTWTQTEELLENTAPSFETIDLAAFQSFGQTDPNLISTHIPYVPVSLIHLSDEYQAHQPSSAPVDYLQRATAAAQTPVVVAPPCVAAGGESEDVRLKHFQDNIPGYINYFLNVDTEEDSYRGSAMGRQWSRVASASRAWTGERGARGSSSGQRRRGRLTQTVAVQEVGVSRLQKLFLQRSGRRVFKTGQGGGAAGRSLCVKTRELLMPTRSGRRRRLLDAFLEVSPIKNAPARSERGAGNTKRGSKKTPQSNQDDRPVGRPRRSRAKPTSPPLSSPPVQSYNLRTLRGSSPSLQASPSPSLLSSAASNVPSTSRRLRSAAACPPAPPPHEEQLEYMDCLLEEVMIGLDFLPKNNNGAPHPHPRPLPPANGSSCASVTASGQSQIVAVERGAAGSYSANSGAQILPEQGEAELENLLLSFEQLIDSCTAGEEEVLGGQSCSMAPVSSSQLPGRQLSEEDETLARCSPPIKAPPGSPAPDKHVERLPAKVIGKRRRKRSRLVRTRARKAGSARRAGSASDTAIKMPHDRRDERLQQMPVMELERSGPPPVRVTLQGHSSQSPDVKDIMQLLEESLLQSEGSPSAGQRGRRRGRPRKGGQPLRLPNDGRSTPPVQPQAVEPSGAEKRREIYEERQEQEVTVLPQGEAEASAWRGKKRGAAVEERTSDDGVVAKRVCFELMPEQSSGDEKPAWRDIELGETEPLLPTCEESRGGDDEIIDVEGESEDDCQEDAGRDDGESRAAPAPVKPSLSPPSHSEVEDEDIDVVGGCGPAPEPVIISWMKSSEGEDEDEDVDLVGP